MISFYAPAVAIVSARIIAGILFFFQGYDKVFSVGIRNTKATMLLGTRDWKLPEWFVAFIAFFTSWVELLCGLLLILGLFKYFAIYLLCLDLIIVAFGFSLAKPMWETGHLLTRLILLIFLLMTHYEHDIFSLDHLFNF